jgi:hypothetical protein
MPSPSRLRAALLFATLILALTGGRQGEGSPSQSPAAEPAPLDPPANTAPVADAAQTDSEAAETSRPAAIALSDWVAVPAVGRYERTPLHQDPIEHAIAHDEWRLPQAGDTIADVSGRERSWRMLSSGPAGPVVDPSLRGGYAATKFESESERVMILDATRHAAACLNGQWRVGDPYGYGFVRLPVVVRPGENWLVCQLVGPGFRAALETPRGPAEILVQDATVPDLVRGDIAPESRWAAVPVTNATLAPLIGARIEASVDGGETTVTELPATQPLGMLKASFRLPLPEPTVSADEVAVQLRVLGPDDNAPPLAEGALRVRLVDPGERHVRTFVSRIDGSAQRYGLAPATPDEKGGPLPAVVVVLPPAGLSSVEGLGRVRPSDWAHVVVPEGRRPYGFDWQDWGEVDVLEALADARRRLAYDPQRTCLVGHGAAAQGVWRIATRHPDRWSAIVASGGWLGFRGPSSEAASPRSVAAQTLAERSETLANFLPLTNLRAMGVFVAAGPDPEAPTDQSRFARQQLGQFHPDFAYAEDLEGAVADGMVRIDAAALRTFLAERRATPSQVADRIEFASVDPAGAGDCHWARVEALRMPGTPARISLQRNRATRQITGETDNLARLSLDLSDLPSDRSVAIALDDSPPLRLSGRPAGGRVWLARDADEGPWRVLPGPPTSEKQARRSGGFQAVFARRPLLVVGTQGGAEATTWAADKARYDAEQFWYRGNGRLEVAADEQFDPSRDRNRNVVLYGNAETNRAWRALLSSSPVQARGELVLVESRPELGDDLGLLLVRPRPGSRTALVGAVGGSGLVGMRATTRLRYFVAGISFPDLTLIGSNTLLVGDTDLRAAGDFGLTWRVDDSIQWRDLAL